MSKERAIKRQRQLKATKYIRYLRRLALARLASDLQAPDPDWWQLVAECAGLNKPSAETIAIIQKRVRKLYADYLK